MLCLKILFAAVAGFRYLLLPAVSLSLGISYDNNNAMVIAPGITTHFSF